MLMPIVRDMLAAYVLCEVAGRLCSISMALAPQAPNLQQAQALQFVAVANCWLCLKLRATNRP
jgi:hypothetical protein